METQVRLTITTDCGWTADFLRDLANEIENSGEVTFDEYETFHGAAEIDWGE
jgi:hypothetical protein